jgi:tetratricopeptide (TPR) repeat protein
MKKTKFLPYSVVFLLVLGILTLGIMVFYQFRAMEEDNLQNKRTVSQLLEAVKLIDSADDTAPGVTIHRYNQVNNADLDSVIAIMQHQYDSYSSHMSFLVGLFSTFVTIFTVGLPIMNHLFFQKDMIQSFQEAHHKIEEEVIEQQKRLNNLAKQMGEVTEALAARDTRQTDEAGRVEGESPVRHVIDKAPQITPIDDTPAAKANALYLQSKVTKDPALALQYIQQAIALDASKADYYFQCCYLFDKMGGHNDEALTAIEKGISLEPNNAYRYFQKSHMLNKMGRYPEALTAIEQAISLKPTNVNYVQAKPCVPCGQSNTGYNPYSGSNKKTK